jgi:hypothetical protein
MSVGTTVSPARAGTDTVTRWIVIDAAMSGASGLLIAGGAPWLDSVLGMPTVVLAALGVFLLAYAGSLVAIARAGSPGAAVAAVIVGNWAWFAGSVIAVFADWLTLTSAGNALTLVQAAAVAVVAHMQTLAVRRRLS